MTSTALDTGTKGTTPFIHYAANVITSAGVTVEQASPFRARIAAAFEMGEPVWIIADEIKLRVAHTSIKATKTPREYATRVVRV
jgi:hypothetical protein